MAVPTPEVVRVNMVLVGLHLLNAPEQIEAFRLATGSDVQVAGAGLIANIQTGIPEPGLTLTLNRDRIALDVSPTRSAISRDYPSRDDLGKLAEVAWKAIDKTTIEEQQLRAFGFNFDLIFEQDSNASAVGYLSRRLFDVEPLGSKGWQFVGGAGRLIFDDGGRRWTIRLEPRFNADTESRVFLSANVHMVDHDLPTTDEIRESLEEVWDEIHDFVKRLDEREP